MGRRDQRRAFAPLINFLANADGTTSLSPGSPLDIATTHVQNGNPGTGTAPCDPGALGSTAGQHLAAPYDRLFGSASIVNVGEGTLFAYNADALADFTDTVLFTDAASVPAYLALANSTEASVSGGAVAHVFDDWGEQMLALDYANGFDAVSAVFMAASIQNEYLVGAGLGANTDWIVTFPTREFYVDEYYTGNAGALAPFSEQASEGLSYVTATPKIYDQEEGFIVPEDFGVPIGTRPFQLPYQVNAISFRSDTQAGTPSGVFGSTLTTDMEHYGAAGWVNVDTATGDGGHALRPDVGGLILHGLPLRRLHGLQHHQCERGAGAAFGTMAACSHTVRQARAPTNSIPCPRRAMRTQRRDRPVWETAWLGTGQRRSADCIHRICVSSRTRSQEIFHCCQQQRCIQPRQHIVKHHTDAPRCGDRPTTPATASTRRTDGTERNWRGSSASRARKQQRRERDPLADELVPDDAAGIGDAQARDHHVRGPHAEREREHENHRIPRPRELAQREPRNQRGGGADGTGASGERPEPKPQAIQPAGWLRIVRRCTASSFMRSAPIHY